MKIKYQGTSGIREITRDGKRYVWAPDVDYSVEISDPDLVAELLTYPRPDFVVDSDDPLAQLPGIGILVQKRGGIAAFVPMGEAGIKLLRDLQSQANDKLARLAIAGVGSIADLAALDDDAAGMVAALTQLEPEIVSQWVDEARNLMEE